MNLYNLLRYLGYLGSAGLLVALDQWTKRVAYQELLYREPIDVLPVLQWDLVLNHGAAFGMLNDAGGYQRYLLSALAMGVSAALVVWLWRCFRENRLLAWALSLILSGALGNLADRLSHGFVIDFINLHYGQWYFPAFNVADVAITLGAILLILDTLGVGRNRGYMQ